MIPMHYTPLAAPCLGLALAVAGIGSGHAQHAPQLERISDPAELATGGHHPGEEVWRVVAPLDSRPLAQRVAEREQQALAGVLPSDGQRSSSVQGSQFVWLRETAVGTTNGNFGQSCLAGSATGFADAHLPIPSDRSLGFFDVWTRDASAAGDLTVRLYATCSPAFNAGAPTQILLSTIQTSGAAGNGFEFQTLGLPGQVTSTCGYFVRMIASNCADGTSLALQKVRVTW
jgi:hypothetical protein